MARSRREDGLSKLQRYRAVQRANGLKLVRLWLPDPHVPGFAEETRRQARLLTGAPEETDAFDFIEQAADWNDTKR